MAAHPSDRGAPTRVLVTGAQGFLGRWICALSARAGTVVVGSGRSPLLRDRYTSTVTRGGAAVPAPLPPGLAPILDDYRPADLTDASAAAALVADVRPDVVVHSAAALRDEAPDLLLAANATATTNVVEAAARLGSVGVVVVSSGSVYGATADLPLTERTACHPIDPYAASKLAAEHLARIAAARAGVPLWIARVFNLLGPGLQERHLPAALAAQLAGIANGAAPPVLRLGDLSTTRDLVDVRDAAAAVVALVGVEAPVPSLAAEHLLAGEGIVNVASGREVAVQAVVDGLVAEVGRRCPLPPLRTDRLPPRRADIPRSVASVDRLSALGHRSTTTLEVSVADMVGYYLDQVWGDAS